MLFGADDPRDLTKPILDACFEVHRHLGPGLLEAIYEECLVNELLDRGLQVERQVILPVIYKGRLVSTPYRLDLLVSKSVVLELKSVDRLHPVFQSQLISYLKLTDVPYGLLVNFNVPMLKDGIKRVYRGPDLGGASEGA